MLLRNRIFLCRSFPLPPLGGTAAPFVTPRVQRAPSTAQLYDQLSAERKQPQPCVG